MNTTNATQSEWAVAVFAARESASELIGTVKAIADACISTRTLIDVLVNGNTTLAAEITEQIKRTLPEMLHAAIQVRVWNIPLGGKAHAWNQYVHLIWPGSSLAFFVDGYATVSPSSLTLLSSEIKARPETIAGTGICLTGRGAQALTASTLAGGGIHGGLFVLTEQLMQTFRNRRFNLPLGLYGFDTLLGAVLAFGGDPSKHSWDAKRFIACQPFAVFTTKPKKWWRYSDVKTQAKRILNNALRVLVLEATRYYFLTQRLAPEALPVTTEDFVMKWIVECPDASRRVLIKHPLSRMALRGLKKEKDWSLAEQTPSLIYSSHPSSGDA